MNNTLKFLGLGLITVGLAACGGNDGPSFQVQELQNRGFTGIVVEEEGGSWGYYGVSADKCRLRMTWRDGDGWDKFKGMTSEVTADAVRQNPLFADCAKTGAPAPANWKPSS